MDFTLASKASSAKSGVGLQTFFFFFTLTVDFLSLCGCFCIICGHFATFYNPRVLRGHIVSLCSCLVSLFCFVFLHF